jgi:predicted anti-sigma-YlaC factor YlaD
MSASAITCRELVELVTDYLEGALDPDTLRWVEGHLAVCPGCSAYLDEMRVTIRLTGRLTDDDIDPVMREALLHAFRAELT